MTVRGGRAAKWRTALLFLSISMASYAGMVFTVNTCLPMLALTHTLYSFVGGMLYHCGEAPQCVYDLRVGGYNGGT